MAKNRCKEDLPSTFIYTLEDTYDSAMINFDHVSYIRMDTIDPPTQSNVAYFEVVLTDGECIHVSDRFDDDIWKDFQNYLINKQRSSNE